MTATRDVAYSRDRQALASHSSDANLGRFIAAIYSTKWLHSSPGYRPPIEVEAAHATIGGS